MMKLTTLLLLIAGGEAFVGERCHVNPVRTPIIPTRPQSNAARRNWGCCHRCAMSNDDDGGEPKSSYPSALNRPDFLRSVGIVAASTASAFAVNPPEPALAGLIQFPCLKLRNTYHLLSAGQSLFQSEDILATNPLFLTNRECALSDLGTRQIEDVCEYLNSGDDVVSPPTIVRHSFAAAAIDTANIVGRELKIGRDRLVPEFFFLDPRAGGLWDNLPITQAEPAIWAMDVDEAGRDGFGGRPPANEDGTPAETLSDQVPRLRQLLSACESIYSGDTVLLIFPDGTGPALLSCLIAGISLSRVHELEYRPGELRTDITYDSVRTMLPEKPSDEYQEKIKLGRIELKKLRSQTTVVNVKDQRYAQELKEEEQRAAEAAKQRAEKEEAERTRREQKAAKERAEKEEAEQTRREQMIRRVEKDRKEKQSTSSDMSPAVTASVAGIGALGVGASIFMGQDEDGANHEADIDIGAVSSTTNATLSADNSTKTTNLTDLGTEDVSVRSINGVPVTQDASIDLDDFAKQAESDNTISVAEPLSVSPNTTSSLPDIISIGSEDERLQKAEEVMEEYMESDDGGDAWLASLSEIINDDESNLNGDEDDKGSFQ